jgi:hypothetical protein
MSASNPGARPLVLVAEPQALQALWLEDLLHDEGYAVLGTYATCEAAVEGLDRSAPVFAIVSVDLRESPGFALSCVLRRRGIPFAMISGSHPVPRPFTDVPILDRLSLAPAIAEALQAGRLAQGGDADPRACPMEAMIRTGEPLALDQCPPACGGQDAGPARSRADDRATATKGGLP